MWGIGQLPDGTKTGASGGRKLADLYVPLKDRLSAWWTGEQRIADSRRPSDNRLQIVVDNGADTDLAWSPSRLQITQDVFGEGFVEPGGAQFARKLLSAADVDPSKTILDLAVGLGGTAFTLAREQDVWMEAFERDGALVEQARALARSYMLSRRVNIQQVDYADISLKQEKYDVIFSRERLFTTQHKSKILRQCGMGLKPTGKLLIIDYLIKSHDNPSKAYQDWAAAEREPIFPWTEEQYTKEFERCGLKLRLSQDFSSSLVEQIEVSWQKTLRTLESSEIDRNYVNALIREGEIWLSRSRALETGDLTLTRMLAIPARGTAP